MQSAHSLKAPAGPAVSKNLLAVLKMHPRTAALLGREQWVQRTPEWFEARREMLTASDAAAALGVKPYPSYRGNVRQELLRKKVANEPLVSMFVTHGQRYEDEARDFMAAAMGEVCYDVGLVRHADVPWLGASPDGVTHSGKLVEIKCPLKRVIQPGVVPHHYYPQIQIQMEVADVDSTIFVQYKPAHLTPDNAPFMDIVVVERDRQWFADHKALLESFWDEYVVARTACQNKRRRVEPEGLWASDPQHAAHLGACLINDSLYADMHGPSPSPPPPSPPPPSPPPSPSPSSSPPPLSPPSPSLVKSRAPSPQCNFASSASP